MRRAAATSRARAGRTTRPPVGLRDRAATGLKESDRLPTPIFTPSTKAETGHDEAIDFDHAADLVGDRDLMARVRDASVALYAFAAEHARQRGVILADTKFEFGNRHER